MIDPACLFDLVSPTYTLPHCSPLSLAAVYSSSTLSTLVIAVLPDLPVVIKVSAQISPPMMDLP